MTYQKDFLDRALAHCGSTYRLCQLAHLDQSNVSKLKRDLRPLSLHELVSICQAIGIDPWEELPQWAIERDSRFGPIPDEHRLKRLLLQVRQTDSEQ
jgi:hypothetical protein